MIGDEEKHKKGWSKFEKMSNEEYEWLKRKIKEYEDSHTIAGDAVKRLDDDVQWAEDEVVNEFPDYGYEY